MRVEEWKKGLREEWKRDRAAEGGEGRGLGEGGKGEK